MKRWLFGSCVYICLAVVPTPRSAYAISCNPRPPHKICGLVSWLADIQESVAAYFGG